MSFISSLLLFLLCLSVHECHARRLGSVHKEHEKKFHLTRKNDEMVSYTKKSVLPTLKPSLSKQQRILANEDSAVLKENQAIDITQKLKNSKANGKESKGREGESSGVGQNESVVSVSWQVPHKKRSERQPGFNLDYSQPKTHPPSHN